MELAKNYVATDGIKNYEQIAQFHKNVRNEGRAV